MIRRPDWLARLLEALEGASAREFQYGDCARLAAECADAMTDGDLRARVAVMIAAADAGISLEELERAIGELVGEAVPMHAARRGDAVLLDHPATGPAIGVCMGERIACPTLHGVTYIRRERGLKAWRIG